MNCERFDQLLPEYLGNELEGGGLREVEEHAVECDRCRRELTSLKETIGVFDRLEAPPIVGAPTTSRRVLALQPLVYAATLLLGLGLGWWIKPAERGHDSVVATNITSSPIRPTKAWLDEQPAFTQNTYKLVRAFSSSSTY